LKNFIVELNYIDLGQRILMGAEVRAGLELQGLPIGSLWMVALEWPHDKSGSYSMLPDKGAEISSTQGKERWKHLGGDR
jgi:hypothetical protein